MLDRMAEELPAEFYRELNGGILLEPGEKRHPEGPGLFIMGEYRTHPVLGRSIVIYFGSFLQLYRGALRRTWERELRKTLRHEFTHHIESLAGERGLERRDKERLDWYRGMR